MNPSDIVFGEKRPMFSDFMLKGTFGREEKKNYLSFLLSHILNKKIEKDKLKFYKNEIGITEIVKISFRCDIAVLYEDTLYIIEANSSMAKEYQFRNMSYMIESSYQFISDGQKTKVCLININNYSNKYTNNVIENYTINDGIDTLFTENLKIYEVYLAKALEKYYTLECKSLTLYLKHQIPYQPKKEEKLTEFEKMLVAGCLMDIDEAKRLVKGCDILMDMISDNISLSYDNGTGEYYQSFIDMQVESLRRGEKRGIAIGEEKAYTEMMKQLQELNVSKEIMEQLKKPKEIAKI